VKTLDYWRDQLMSPGELAEKKHLLGLIAITTSGVVHMGVEMLNYAEGTSGRSNFASKCRQLSTERAKCRERLEQLYSKIGDAF
jgi:hypothetical protein